MKRMIIFLVIIAEMFALLSACSNTKMPDDFVLIKGGTFISTKSRYYGKNVTIPDYYIGKYEITQKEWVDIMGRNPSELIGEKMPVDSVSWYACVEYCNKRSIKEGLKPYYNIDKNRKDKKNMNTRDKLKWTVTLNKEANGYRLPTEVEWEYAASGGQMSKSYTYSGSNDIEEVAWYWINSGKKKLSGKWAWNAIQDNKDTSKSVGGKKPNELGLYDMSGNIREWCWDWYGEMKNDTNFISGNYIGPDSGTNKVWKGGGWIGDDKSCTYSNRESLEPDGDGSDQGFRVCRGK